MYRKAGIVSLLTGIGSLLLASTAHATLYNLDVGGVPGIETGSYHVVLDSTNNNMDWQVLSVHANGGANTPSADVFRVRLYFYSGQNETGVNIGQVGFTPGNSAGVNPAETNWGAGLSHSGGGNPHFTNYGEYMNLNKPANDLLKNGSNTWSQIGAFTIPTSAMSVEVQLNDGFAYVGDFNAVPEASSLALLLPALIPMGFVLRRRYIRS